VRQGLVRVVRDTGAVASTLAFVTFVACGKSPATPGLQADGAPIVDGAASAVVIERTPEVQRLWDEAQQGEEDDLVRLANREGPAGLAERASVPALRSVALRAMGYTHTFDGLPLLGDAAARDPEPLAIIAVESAAMLASRKRRATDPEDALELREGCTKLSSVSTDGARPATVRAGALRALRMLAEWGCTP
jgi:hypothetical protein